MSRSEVRARRPAVGALAASLLAAAICAGCGKGQLRTGSAPPARSTAAGVPHAGGAAAGTAPLPLTAARVAAFAHAVELFAADLPGSVPEPPQSASGAREREAARCGVPGAPALGGGHSPDFHRGRALEREGFSSGVEVLGSEAEVRRDLEYAASSAGIACYSRVVRRTLAGEEGAGARVTRLRLAPIHVTLPGGETASGVRISSRISLTGSPVGLSLFLDALSVPYGQAELDLYANSFVQPPPARTEQELLYLLRQRARLHPL